MDRQVKAIVDLMKILGTDLDVSEKLEIIVSEEGAEETKED